MSSHRYRIGPTLAADHRTTLALTYLALPYAIFLVGWCREWAVMLGLTALAAVLLPLMEVRPGKSEGGAAPKADLAVTLLIAAVGWAVLGGAGHIFYANSDWLVRDAVLRDLVVESWPVRYSDGIEEQRVLRAPIAYYLPAALVGHIFGLRAADLALLGWTVLGVWLMLMLVVDGTDSRRMVAIKLVAIIFFSGMDFVGTALSGSLPGSISHLEWWAKIFQYSSNTTQLFWVPNHALPGWIAAALIYRRWGDPSLVRLIPALLALVPLWSPLTAIGILPLAIAAFLVRLRMHGADGSVVPHAWAGALILSVLIGAYITADSERIASGWIWDFERNLPVLALLYLLFVTLEYLLIWLLVTSVYRPPVVLISGAILAVLPLYAFGPSNDLVMRASIPALMVLTLALADAAPRLADRSSPVKVQVTALFVFVLGSITPLTEIARALAEPRWSASLTRRVVDATDGIHYLADAANPRLNALLRLRPTNEGR